MEHGLPSARMHTAHLEALGKSVQQLQSWSQLSPGLPRHSHQGARCLNKAKILQDNTVKAKCYQAAFLNAERGRRITLLSSVLILPSASGKIEEESVLLRELSRMELGARWETVTHASQPGGNLAFWPFIILTKATRTSARNSRYLVDPYPKVPADSLRTSVSWHVNHDFCPVSPTTLWLLSL